MNNPYYKAYSSMKKKELRILLETPDELCYEAQLAMQQVIREKHLENVLESEQVDQLNKTVEEEQKKIDNLFYLGWLGIDVYHENNESIIRKSKSGFWRDFWGFFIAGFCFLIFLMLVGSTQNKEIPPNGRMMSAIIGFIVIIYGIVIFSRTINRYLLFKGFKLTRTSSKITLSNRPGFSKQTTEYPPNAKILVTEEENIQYLQMQESNEETHEILQFKNLDNLGKLSLEKLVEKFNSNQL